jgi:hypothetical protein
MQSKTKLITVVKQWGKLTSMKALSHVCKSRKEDGIYHLSTIEIAKAQRKITRSILKRCKTSKLDQRFHLIGNIIVKG